MTPEAAGESYEDEPYAELTYQQTQPDLLATIGRLLGLEPAPVETCRVLELGCAAGANILALAEAMPAADFVGLDYSSRQIEEGRNAARALGRDNVAFHHADIRELPALNLGTFDYVIAHGVYSWVPADVRDALLASCRELLNPHGIAYISYNAYPGWANMRSLRDALLFRSRRTQQSRQRADEAESFIKLLQEANPPNGDHFGQFLAAYEAQVSGRHALGGERAASLLLHDELADINEPVYFHEFVEHAARYGLQYLADSDFPSVFPTRLPAAVRAEIGRLAADATEHQQYLDFVTNASFKQTLLCQEELTVVRSIGKDLRPIRGLYASSAARPEGVSPGSSVERFRGEDGARLSAQHPVARAAMRILVERFPERIAFPRLLDQARARCRRGAAEAKEEDEAQLAALLLQGFCYSGSLVELRTTAGAFTTESGSQPRTTRFALRQLAAGMTTVTNLRHERITLEPSLARLLSLFDGTRSLQQARAAASNMPNKAFEGALDTFVEMALFAD